MQIVDEPSVGAVHLRVRETIESRTRRWFLHSAGSGDLID
jgi:hypothetical protein